MGNAIVPMNEVFRKLDKMKSAIAAIVPTHVTGERMMRVFRTAVQRTPKLAQCTEISLFGCLVESSQLGLEVNSPLQHAFLVPFENKKARTAECQLIISYRGLVDLCRRSGEIKEIYAEVVYENDEFEVVKGLNRDLKHKETTGDRGELTYVYAVAHFINGGSEFIVMDRDEVMKHRATSRGAGADDSPWKTWEPDMWKKTALRKICKTLPTSSEVSRAIALNDAADRGETQPIEADFSVIAEVVGEQPTQADPMDAQVEGLSERIAAERKADAGTPNTPEEPADEPVSDTPVDHEDEAYAIFRDLNNWKKPTEMARKKFDAEAAEKIGKPVIEFVADDWAKLHEVLSSVGQPA